MFVTSEVNGGTIKRFMSICVRYVSERYVCIHASIFHSTPERSAGAERI